MKSETEREEVEVIEISVESGQRASDMLTSSLAPSDFDAISLTGW